MMSNAPPRPRTPIIAALRITAALLIGFVACLLAYLAVAVPGPWFASASAVVWGANDLRMAQGSGRIVDGELLVTASDATDRATISVATDLRASDYPAIAWIALDVPGDAEAFLLWQSDGTAGAIDSIPLRVEAGRILQVSLQGQAKWTGRIKGLALAVRFRSPQPFRVRGVVAKTLGAGEMLVDRAAEWTAFESWTGTSINTLTGGADTQDLPLPALLAAAILVAALLIVAVRDLRPGAPGTRFGVVLAGLFLAGWLVLDTRWMANLAQQASATTRQYAGKPMREKILSDEDGKLYAFIEQARRILPAQPARIFIASDAQYLQGRAAYHLYPNNVFFAPRSNAMPAAAALKPGDWLVVYQRRGVQYNGAEQRLRWDDDQTIAAELKLAGSGGALFLVR
jgi:hypothetical protein